MNWKYFYSSVKGTSHIANNSEKQDNCNSIIFTVDGNNYLVSAVADGAGSAKHSDVSSGFICKLFLRKMKQWLEANDIENFSRDIVSEWFQYFQKVMHRVVKRYQLESIRELATTLLFVVLSDKLNIFVQIGDGIIAIGDKGDLSCVFMPQNGEFLNTTNFATQSNVDDLFMFTTITKPVKYLAMHTDGIEQISFDFQTQKPFQPFFVPFYNALEKADNGYSETLSRQLDTFLQSERVNKKTDDDKTLFLALAQDFPIISNLEESTDE